MEPKPEQQLLPTPELGLPILWYMDDMDTANCATAMCTKIEAPGRIGVVVFSHNHVASYKSGVHWIGDDRRLAPDRPFRRNGCWDFVPSLKPRNALKLHQDYIAAKKAAEEARDAEIKRVQEERARFAAEKKKSVAESTK